ANERPARFEQLYDGLVRLEDLLALVFRQAFGKRTAFVNRTVDFEAIFDAGLVVFSTVARRGMHTAGAVLRRDVAGQHSGYVAVKKRVAHPDMLQLVAGDPGQNLARFESRFSERGFVTAALEGVRLAPC